ncbi:MAG: tetratricopeptide repeat protein [Desulfobaccales bacterium]
MTGRQWKIIACIVLALATFAVYGEVGSHRFIHFDDGAYVFDNPVVREGLTLNGVKWAFTTLYAGYWMPLTWLSHMLDCQIFGLSAGGHHLTNLLFHIANALLLFLWLLRATRAPGPAFLVAALFAWHPLHVESVAWVAERKDVLSTFFWLLTMWAYLWYVERPAAGRYLLILLCFGLGLMAKPMLVTLPLALLLLDYWPLNRWTPGLHRSFSDSALRESYRDRWPRLSSLGGRLVLEKVPLLILSLLCSVVTIFAQRTSGALARLGEVPLSERVATALAAYVWYPLKMLWPSRLAVLYPHPLDSIPLWQELGAGLLLALTSLLLLRLGRRYPYLLVGWLWYLGTLLPVIGLVQVGDQAWADRFTYVPLLGLFIIFAWGAREVTAGWPGARILRPGGAGLILAALLAVTFFQVRLWRDSITLFEHTLSVTADNYLIQHNLGVALAARDQREQAARHFTEALRLNPANARAQNRRGEDLVAQGRIAEGIARFQTAVKLKPDFLEAYNNLGLAYASQGRMDQAIAMFHQAITLDPNFAAAYKNLGLALACQGRKQEARKMLEKAVQINPNDPEAKKFLLDLKTLGPGE